ncbi:MULTISPECIES: helix-turn-helix domain-containing protein [Hyphomicrobiales]|jgi:DNA-binding HxlR family transcriptional regulator|uniref:winged helix-turn-helix transcriptional regulator n=1 Tax=Methylobacterium sp. CCH7-A2 TaxID=1768789 RepID=UPI0008336B52|nr:MULTISPECIES: helix-turn-helix domain-containing protein [Hyphomicrobiales]
MTETVLPRCGVERFLLLLDGPWATLIIRELLHGPRRFTELRHALSGISAHTLTHRLRRFEEHGLVTRTAFAETPPRVVYELTPLGASLKDVLYAMKDWGDSITDETLSGSGDTAAPKRDQAGTAAASSP